MFHEELKNNINSEISETETIEMIAQHIITKPVFDSLFGDDKFTTENAISKAMNDLVQKINIEIKDQSLEKFYASVRKRSEGIVNPKTRQKLVIDLYEDFFKKAFPLVTQRLGIVYTPVEIVDFINLSVDIY